MGFCRKRSKKKIDLGKVEIELLEKLENDLDKVRNYESYNRELYNLIDRKKKIDQKISKLKNRENAYMNTMHYFVDSYSAYKKFTKKYKLSMKFHIPKSLSKKRFIMLHDGWDYDVLRDPENYYLKDWLGFA